MWSWAAAKGPERATEAAQESGTFAEEEEAVFYDEGEEVDDIEEEIHSLARMIMKHEREQRANALGKYDRLLGFV